MTRRLTALEAAARLGIKPQTLYAYVSRGLLDRERGPVGSTFDPLEVERFARSRRSNPADPAVLIKDGRPSGGPLMTIETDIALIEDDGLYYRGRSAIELAVGADFEQVCWHVWGRTDSADRAARFRPLPGTVEAVRRTLVALPGAATVGDRIRVAVPVVAMLDPLRDELAPESVTQRIGAVTSTLVASIGDDHGPALDDHDHPIAAQLTYALLPALDDHEADRVIGCVNAALILLIDHDLAASTMAARVAASARANPYAVISAGLAALDSALHGNVSRLTYRMLQEVRDGAPAGQVIARTVAAGQGGVPGFGHLIYRATDPRAELIFDLLRDVPGSGPTLAAVAEVTDLVATHGIGFRNVDLALAALALAAGMTAEAGQTIFAIGRIAGWTAHALNEYSQPPLRLRPVGRYVGP